MFCSILLHMYMFRMERYTIVTISQHLPSECMEVMKIGLCISQYILK